VAFDQIYLECFLFSCSLVAAFFFMFCSRLSAALELVGDGTPEKLEILLEDELLPDDNKKSTFQTNDEKNVIQSLYPMFLSCWRNLLTHSLREMLFLCSKLTCYFCSMSCCCSWWFASWQPSQQVQMA
jgi:hypothetical protein